MCLTLWEHYIKPSLEEFIRKTIKYIKDAELRINDLVDIDMVYNDLVFTLKEVLEGIPPYKYRVNSLKVNKAQKVIHSYAKAVENRSGLIEDIKLLPYPISEIKRALKIGIAACILNDNPSNQFYCNNLKTMYIVLGDYVDLSDTDKVALNEVTKLNGIQSTRESILAYAEVVSSGNYARYQEILESTLQTNNELQKELTIFCDVVETIRQFDNSNYQ